jgi:ubiquinone/menaquinone biosynthesis C-methylase UbiE/uncharacterized protein YbaR (Trm112 family)
MNGLNYLRCINCDAENSLVLQDQTEVHLQCQHCKTSYRVINSIPRFVRDEAYGRSFGVEWAKHQVTQYDRYFGKKLSEERFFNETEWNRDLSGQILIEAGCGSGRFTEWALSTGAIVLSFDLSNAVEVNQKNNGGHPNLLLVQADLFQIPFKKGMADKLFCFGVLQHTPHPKQALYSLLPFVKENGGEIVFDIYVKRFHTKYLIRLCRNWIDLLWPIASFLRKISPAYGPRINWQLMIADHSRDGVANEKLREWAYLNTFDMLSPRYDKPSTLKEVMSWLEKLKREKKIKNFLLKQGYNGINGKIYR